MHALNHTLRRQRQVDLYELKSSLVYIVHLGQPGLCSKTLSPKRVRMGVGEAVIHW